MKSGNHDGPIDISSGIGKRIQEIEELLWERTKRQLQVSEGDQ